MRRGLAMRALWILALPLALGACAAPLTVASLALSGLSYATTGKSISDHTISAMAGRDCALLRAMAGGPVCRERPAGPAITMTTLAAVPRAAGSGFPPPPQGVARSAIEPAAGPPLQIAEGPGPVPLPMAPPGAAPMAPPAAPAGADSSLETAVGPPPAPAPWPATPPVREGFYLIRAGGPQLVLRMGALEASCARLEGFGPGVELFALVQDDGALEVFVHDPAGPAANLRLVLRLDGWTRDPSAFTGIWLNGALHLVGTIIV